MIKRLGVNSVNLVKTVDILKRRGLTIDIDGVEVASEYPAVKDYNLSYGFRLKSPKTVDDITEHWILVDWLSRDPQIQNPREATVSLWNSQKVLESAGYVEGARAVLQYLAARGLNPPRVTSRPGYTFEWTRNWYLKKYGPKFDFGLLRLDQSGVEVNPDFKVDEIERLGFGYHFDDSPKDAERIAGNGTTVVLVPQPWNLDYQPTDKRIIKVERYEHRFKMTRAFLTLAERITNS